LANIKEKVRELSAVICAKCNAKDYTKCASECRIHKLLNEIIIHKLFNEIIMELG